MKKTMYRIVENFQDDIFHVFKDGEWLKSITRDNIYSVAENILLEVFDALKLVDINLQEIEACFGETDLTIEQLINYLGVYGYPTYIHLTKNKELLLTIYNVNITYNL